MDTFNLGVNLTEEELASLSPKLRQVALSDIENAKIIAARQAIYNAYKSMPRKIGLRHTFSLAVEYKQWSFGAELKTLLLMALELRFNGKAMTNSRELGMISDILQREEIKSSLSQFPWKEKFLASAQSEMPDAEEINALIEIVEKSGINKQEYIEALREAVRREEAKKGLTLAIFQAKDTLNMFTADRDDHIARLLAETDKYLRKKGLVYRAIEEYELLLEAGIDIGDGRVSVMDAYKKQEGVGRKEDEAILAAIVAGLISNEVEAKVGPWWRIW